MLREPVQRQPSCDDSTEPSMLSVEQARQQILSTLARVPGEEKLSLKLALNRFLAQDVVSPIDVPGHTNSAVDGYAFNCSALTADGPQQLAVIGTAYAGKPYAGTCAAGQCVRIMTGAPIPPTTDTVVMQEHVEIVRGGSIRFDAIKRGANVRQAGEDIGTGETVLKSGKRLSPADLGVLASLGFAEVRVHRRPRVAFFSTGDELRSVGEALAEGEIYDSNRYSLYGMLARQDTEIIDMGTVVDDPQAIRDALTTAAQIADVVITSGGVSVGEADYIKKVLLELGNIEFWKIAMKPGRPLTFGRIGESLFFGLPGNPVAVMVTYYQFVQPAIHYLAGGGFLRPLTLTATCATAIRKRSGRFEFQRGVLSRDDKMGEYVVHKTGKQGSGILTSMSLANCFILLPEDRGDIAAGEIVTVQPFDGLV